MDYTVSFSSAPGATVSNRRPQPSEVVIGIESREHQRGRARVMLGEAQRGQIRIPGRGGVDDRPVLGAALVPYPMRGPDTAAGSARRGRTAERSSSLTRGPAAATSDW